MPTEKREGDCDDTDTHFTGTPNEPRLENVSVCAHKAHSKRESLRNRKRRLDKDNGVS